MTPIRVLVADDSGVARAQIAQMIETDPELTVVATASSGRMVLEQVRQLHPDMVVLDLALPDMNGLDVLKVLRQEAPQVRVVMFSALTGRGGTLTMDALALGASDYLTKPSSHGALERPLDTVRDELVAKLKALHARSSPGLAAGRRVEVPPTPPPLPPRPLRVTAVVIGAATGGPGMLPEVLGMLPAGFPVPVLIAQHIPPIFSRLLAERLERICRLSVREARGGEPVEVGQAWVAPGGHHLTVALEHKQARLALHPMDPGEGGRTAVDVLFRSAAESYGSGVLAVVMTGMGQDGLLGCEAVSEAGGQILVQEPGTCIVGDMPRAVMESGLPYRAVPLKELGQEIVRRTLRVRDPSPETVRVSSREG